MSDTLFTLSSGADVNAVDSVNVSPILAACYVEHNEAVLMLLDYDADVNIVPHNGNSILHLLPELEDSVQDQIRTWRGIINLYENVIFQANFEKIGLKNNNPIQIYVVFLIFSSCGTTHDRHQCTVR